MVCSDLFSAGVFVAVAYSHSAIQLMVLAAAPTVVGAPFGPASSALLVMLVPEPERARATAARASGIAVGTVLGGALGGVVVAAFGGRSAFLLNAGSFVISALLVVAVRGRFGSGAFGFGIATAGYGVGNFIGARLGRHTEGAF